MPPQRRSFTTTLALHDIINRALSSAGLNAVLEPVGLNRGDVKGHDDMTVFPFSWEST